MNHPNVESPPSDAAAPFLQLSRRVERRLFLSRWLDRLRATALPVFGALAAGLAAAWLADVTSLPIIARAVFPAALVLVIGWAVTCGVLAWVRRPDAVAALAVFDERRDDEELFVSAFSFAADRRRGPGADLHLHRAHAALSDASGDLRATIPVRVAPPAVWAPLVFLGLSLFGLPALAAAPPPEDATAEAAAVGRSLDEEARSLDQMDEALSADEKEKLEELKEELENSARKMADLEKEKTPREVLEELEKRAKEAEALADMLGADGEEIGSAMLAELERHADTAELAGALRGQKLDDASKEATKLARRLRNEDLSLEARKRMERAFNGGLESATAADLKTLLGRHLTKAQSQLEQDDAKRAAEEFEALAKRYQQMLERMNAMEALKRLAQNLRTSGQRALGRNQAGMQKIDSLSSAGLSKVGNQPVKLAMAQPGQMNKRPGSPMAGQPSGQPSSQAPVPGTGQPNSGQPQGKPCPGCPNCQGKNASGTPVPGTKPGSSGAPIPGTKPGGT